MEYKLFKLSFPLSSFCGLSAIEKGGYPERLCPTIKISLLLLLFFFFFFSFFFFPFSFFRSFLSFCSCWAFCVLIFTGSVVLLGGNYKRKASPIRNPRSSGQHCPRNTFSGLLEIYCNGFLCRHFKISSITVETWYCFIWIWYIYINRYPFWSREQLLAYRKMSLGVFVCMLPVVISILLSLARAGKW